MNASPSQSQIRMSSSWHGNSSSGSSASFNRRWHQPLFLPPLRLLLLALLLLPSLPLPSISPEPQRGIIRGDDTTTRDPYSSSSVSPSLSVVFAPLVAPAAAAAESSNTRPARRCIVFNFHNVDHTIREAYRIENNLKSSTSYFCGSESPESYLCHCGPEDICKQRVDVYGVNIGQCGCCSGWAIAIIVLGATAVCVLIPFLICAYGGGVGRMRWWTCGYPERITFGYMRLSTAAPSPAGQPFTRSLFTQYSPYDFADVGDEFDNLEESIPRDRRPARRRRRHSPAAAPVNAAAAAAAAGHTNSNAMRINSNNIRAVATSSASASASASAAAAATNSSNAHATSGGSGGGGGGTVASPAAAPTVPGMTRPDQRLLRLGHHETLEVRHPNIFDRYNRTVRQQRQQRQEEESAVNPLLAPPPPLPAHPRQQQQQQQQRTDDLL